MRQSATATTSTIVVTRGPVAMAGSSPSLAASLTTGEHRAADLEREVERASLTKTEREVAPCPEQSSPKHTEERAHQQLSEDDLTELDEISSPEREPPRHDRRGLGANVP